MSGLPFPISCVQKGWVEGLVCGADLRHGGRGLRPVAAFGVFPLPRSRGCPCLHQRVLPLVDVFVFEILLVVSSLWSHNWFCPWTRPGSNERVTILFPFPFAYKYLASTTCDQSLVELKGSFFHLLTMRTQALQMSPSLSRILKHPRKLSAYLSLSVKREL